MKLRRPDANSAAVYSTDRTPGPSTEPAAAPSSGPAAGSVLRIRLEKKGRGGKAVTVIAGPVGNAQRSEELARLLKTYCGAGGTVKGAGAETEIEIQGDHRTRAAAQLRQLGFVVKGA